MATRTPRFQAVVTTTNNSATTISTIAAAASTTTVINAYVVGRRTGGSSGTAEDGCFYHVQGCIKNVSGTATIIGAVSVSPVIESNANCNAGIAVSSGNILLQVTGDTNNNYSWRAYIDVFAVSSV
jgi:hypothetical protein